MKFVWEACKGSFITSEGLSLSIRSIWVDEGAGHDPVGGARENVALEEGPRILSRFKKN